MIRRILIDTNTNEVALAVELTPEQVKIFDYLIDEYIIDTEKYLVICANDEDFERIE